MNSYMIADLVLTLVSIGIRADAIRAELNVMKAAGKTDEEICAHLRSLANDAVKRAQAVVDGA